MLELIYNMFLNLSIGLGIPIFLAAFIAEYFDSSLGMGYGTTLTPVLLFMGYTPMQIVPAVLLSEMITLLNKLCGFMISRQAIPGKLQTKNMTYPHPLFLRMDAGSSTILIGELCGRIWRRAFQ